jgi:DNA invertase Pin-like site-specific DNA recombinase
LVLKRVAVYYRVSTDKQDFDSQKHAIDAWIEQHNPATVYTFQDFAMSGSNPHRPQLKKMLKLAKQDKIDAVITYRLDRLSRTALDAIEICISLDRAGVELICVKQNLFTTRDNPFRRTMMTLFAELAELERGILIQRIKDGLSAAKARGVRLGPPTLLTQERIETIRNLREQKKTFREISSQLKLSVGTVHKALRM